MTIMDSAENKDMKLDKRDLQDMTFTETAHSMVRFW